MYYNVHTHSSLASAPGTLCIANAYKDFEQNIAGNKYCSIGLHPWYLANAKSDFETITKFSTNPKALAIGECGLDKVCDTGWQLQTDMLVKQINLVNDVGKPLIIHCVRAFEELMQIFQLHPARVPVIIHGYNKNAILAKRLLAKGYYLSFGKAILNGSGNATEVLSTINASSFFLETDDAGIDIAAIYKKAAEIRQTTEEEVILQVRNNFQKVFKI